MTADRARGALAVPQDADGKFLCEVPCGYIVEPTASAYHIRRERVRAQRRRRAMLRRRVALTIALLTVAALLAALMPWSGSGAADKPKETTAGTLEEVHQPTAVLLPSSGTVAEYVPNAAEVEALAKLIYGEAGIVPSTTEQAAVDCPVCGCQIALAIRVPRADLSDNAERHDADALNIPASPYPDGDKGVLACPNCGSGEYLHNADENENAFCGQCGQAIKWGCEDED